MTKLSHGRSHWTAQVMGWGLLLLYVLPAEAATYYVATDGDDARSCATGQNINTPKRNIMGTNGGMACLTTPGDKLYVRGGTYDESVSNVSTYQLFPSGTSWDHAFTVAAYPGETVTLTQAMGFGDCCQNPPMPQMSYWIFDGFRLNATDPNNNGLLYNG